MCEVLGSLWLAAMPWRQPALLPGTPARVCLVPLVPPHLCSVLRPLSSCGPGLASVCWWEGRCLACGTCQAWWCRAGLWSLLSGSVPSLSGAFTLGQPVTLQAQVFMLWKLRVLWCERMWSESGGGESDVLVWKDRGGGRRELPGARLPLSFSART